MSEHDDLKALFEKLLENPPEPVPWEHLRVPDVRPGRIRQILRAVRRSWWVVLSTLILAGVIALASTLLAGDPEGYSAEIDASFDLPLSLETPTWSGPGGAAAGFERIDLTALTSNGAEDIFDLSIDATGMTSDGWWQFDVNGTEVWVEFGALIGSNPDWFGSTDLSCLEDEVGLVFTADNFIGLWHTSGSSTVLLASDATEQWDQPVQASALALPGDRVAVGAQNADDHPLDTYAGVLGMVSGWHGLDFVTDAMWHMSASGGPPWSAPVLVAGNGTGPTWGLISAIDPTAIWLWDASPSPQEALWFRWFLPVPPGDADGDGKPNGSDPAPCAKPLTKLNDQTLVPLDGGFGDPYVSATTLTELTTVPTLAPPTFASDQFEVSQGWWCAPESGIDVHAGPNASSFPVVVSVAPGGLMWARGIATQGPGGVWFEVDVGSQTGWAQSWLLDTPPCSETPGIPPSSTTTTVAPATTAGTTTTTAAPATTAGTTTTVAGPSPVEACLGYPEWSGSLDEFAEYLAGEGFNVIGGEDADEELVGTDGPDAIFALGGNDVIRGEGGPDCLFAGDGDDVVIGGDGADAVFGEGGSDSLDAGSDPHDYEHGGPGSDECVLFGRGADECES